MRSLSFVLACTALLAGCASARTHGADDDDDDDGTSVVDASIDAGAASDDGGGAITDAGAGSGDAGTAGIYHLTMPDSPTRACANLTTGAPISCPAPGTPEAQDGSYLDPPVTWSVAGEAPGTARELVSGRVWQRALSTAMTGEAAYVYCSSLVLGGIDDWRLPTVAELVSITDLGRSAPPFVDENVVPTPVGAAQWAMEWWESYPNIRQRWTVDFHGVSVQRVAQEELHQVRCVQGPNWLYPTPHWSEVATGIWHDAIDGLDWYIVHSSATDNSTQASAAAFCENGTWLGHSDWRLPSMKEVVASLYFRIAGGTWFLAQWETSWSALRTSTPRPGTSTFYRVDAWNGRIGTNVTANQVVCVRNQPTGAPPPN